MLGGRVVALVEGGQLPIELDYHLESSPDQISTDLDGGFTAHPKRDPATGDSRGIDLRAGRRRLR
jgi:carotenoid cleavage dioxygenase